MVILRTKKNPQIFDKNHLSNSRAFSIVELVIAMTIFVTLTSVLLFNYNKLNSHLTLDTLAHEIAQWVRTTQVSAMSVKHTQSDTSIFPGYGLRFDRSSPGEFIFFADLDGNKQYAPLPVGSECGDPGVECEQRIILRKGNILGEICGESTNTTVTSAGCPLLKYAENFDIVFTRPDPDASIIGEDTIGNPINYARAKITVLAQDGYQRSIEIWTTGQVSVK